MANYGKKAVFFTKALPALPKFIFLYSLIDATLEFFNCLLTMKTDWKLSPEEEMLVAQCSVQDRKHNTRCTKSTPRLCSIFVYVC